MQLWVIEMASSLETIHLTILNIKTVACSTTPFKQQPLRKNTWNTGMAGLLYEPM